MSFRAAPPVLAIALPLLPTLGAPALTRAADQPQWGQRFSRNMVSDEHGLPDSFDPKTGAHIKWTAELGTESYATPIVASGRVFIGTNNQRPRDPKHQGDRAVLTCLDEQTGKLVWQFVIPKISEDAHDPFLDWPKAGFASAPTIEGDRVYTLTNRGEIACLDLHGMANGNDGPYTDEARHLAPRGSAPIEPGSTDADILWLTDLVAQVGIRTHDQVHGSILIDGDLLYVNSCNGVDNTHRVIRSPDAPSLVVLDKRTGRIVARDDQHIGPNIFHCAWSSPSLGEVNGKRLIFFGGDDGFLYAFDALSGVPSEAGVLNLHNVWAFDSDPTAPKTDVHKWVQNRKEGPSVIMGMPVFDHGRVYFTSGGDLWWGKRQGLLKCVDASGKGDVTKSAEVWSYPLTKDACATPAVYDGMVFATDCGGTVHCVDAATGAPIWTHKISGAEIWASALVADGKVYVGTRRGEFVVLAASREKRVLSTIDLGESIAGTATAAKGTLYVATMGHLYAVK